MSRLIKEFCPRRFDDLLPEIHLFISNLTWSARSATYQILLFVQLERRLSDQTLEYDASQCPPIDGVRVVEPLDNLGSLYMSSSAALLAVEWGLKLTRYSDVPTKDCARSYTTLSRPLTALRLLPAPLPAHHGNAGSPWYRDTCNGSGSPRYENSFARPKSAKTAWPWALIRIFSGLRSRAMIPSRCLFRVS